MDLLLVVAMVEVAGSAFLGVELVFDRGPSEVEGIE